MAMVPFTDIIIVGNNVSKPPRRDGRNKEGKDQFLITFSLSGSARRAWVETFKLVWEGREKQAPPFPLPVVSDDQIQITCPLDDHLQAYLEDLRREVATTNQVYREHLQAADDERRGHEEILQKLRF